MRGRHGAATAEVARLGGPAPHGQRAQVLDDAAGNTCARSPAAQGARVVNWRDTVGEDAACGPSRAAPRGGRGGRLGDVLARPL